MTTALDFQEVFRIDIFFVDVQRGFQIQVEIIFLEFKSATRPHTNSTFLTTPHLSKGHLRRQTSSWLPPTRLVPTSKACRDLKQEALFHGCAFPPLLPRTSSWGCRDQEVKICGNPSFFFFSSVTKIIQNMVQFLFFQHVPYGQMEPS